jgi:large subunit ribosomal protein L9
MKVILNKDLSTLGEEGDVKDVAKGYARNYLFPRGIALPYTPKTVKLFEARKGEIETKKAQKRQDALGIKERLENLELSLTMPAGANGKLYGAVTSQTVSDELLKQGFQIERKRIDLAGTGIKNVGKYKAFIKLYENSQAEIQLTIIGQEIKTETSHAPARPARRRRDSAPTSVGGPTSAGTPAEAGASAETGVEQAHEAAPVETAQAEVAVAQSEPVAAGEPPTAQPENAAATSEEPAPAPQAE